MSDGIYIDPDADKAVKKKRTRRQRYEFVGGGIRDINGVQVRTGGTALLTPKQVTREWRKVDG